MRQRCRQVTTAKTGVASGVCRKARVAVLMAELRNSVQEQATTWSGVLGSGVDIVLPVRLEHDPVAGERSRRIGRFVRRAAVRRVRPLHALGPDKRDLIGVEPSSRTRVRASSTRPSRDNGSRDPSTGSWGRQGCSSRSGRRRRHHVPPCSGATRSAAAALRPGPSQQSGPTQGGSDPPEGMGDSPDATRGRRTNRCGMTIHTTRDRPRRFQNHSFGGRQRVARRPYR